MYNKAQLMSKKIFVLDYKRKFKIIFLSVIFKILKIKRIFIFYEKKYLILKFKFFNKNKKIISNSLKYLFKKS